MAEHSQVSSLPANTRLEVFNVKDTSKDGEDQKSFWTRIGVGFVNKDGSLNIVLDALPRDGKLTVRLPRPKEES